jgi:hypothetical protein
MVNRHVIDQEFVIVGRRTYRDILVQPVLPIVRFVDEVVPLLRQLGHLAPDAACQFAVLLLGRQVTGIGFNCCKLKRLRNFNLAGNT